MKLSALNTNLSNTNTVKSLKKALPVFGPSVVAVLIAIPVALAVSGKIDPTSNLVGSTAQPASALTSNATTSGSCTVPTGVTTSAVKTSHYTRPVAIVPASTGTISSGNSGTSTGNSGSGNNGNSGSGNNGNSGANSGNSGANSGNSGNGSNGNTATNNSGLVGVQVLPNASVLNGTTVTVPVLSNDATTALNGDLNGVLNDVNVPVANVLNDVKL